MIYKIIKNNIFHNNIICFECEHCPIHPKKPFLKTRWKLCLRMTFNSVEEKLDLVSYYKLYFDQEEMYKMALSCKLLIIGLLLEYFATLLQNLHLKTIARKFTNFTFFLWECQAYLFGPSDVPWTSLQMFLLIHQCTLHHTPPCHICICIWPYSFSG